MVDVAVERAVGGLDQLWSYLPGPLSPVANAVGYRVSVPLGRGRANAIVLRQRSLPAEATAAFKTVLAVLDPQPALTPALAELALWLSERYLAFIGQTVRAMVPPGVRQGIRPVDAVPKRWVALGGGPPARARRQLSVWQWLAAQGPQTRVEILAEFPGAGALLLALSRAGFIGVQSGGETVATGTGPELNDEQAQAVASIMGGGTTWLLEGVTGSGKTEVYMECIGLHLDQGRQAMVLVPEIALTPQTVARFRQRFGEGVEVWHSGLSPGERVGTWQRVRSGQSSLVVGARSAVFLPFPRLGLIVLDEEHETTYKQDEHPRYHAREVAEERARLEGCQVVLGSATPALESAWRARAGHIGWIRLTRRALARAMPAIAVVDMRAELRRGNKEMLSEALSQAMTATLEKGEQAILFLNRRGYATYIFCRDCGLPLSCPHCAVTLTYHQETHRLTCHYCFYDSAPPPDCPACHSARIRYFGAGTERVVETVHRLWPSARVLRADRDTLTGRKSHQEMWQTFMEHGADVLVGTQMIAKGMDWPGVTLVGILAADVALNFPDFRSGERTFQLLVQAAGRAGRGDKPGRVVVQTYNPEHYAINRALESDFDGFLAQEITFRQGAGYPPFTNLWLLEIRAAGVGEAAAAAQAAAAWVREHVEDGVEVLGPAPAPISRIREFHRFHILVKARLGAQTRQVLSQLLRKLPDVQVTVDPYFML